MDDLKVLLQKAESPRPLPEGMSQRLEAVWVGAVVPVLPYSPGRDLPQKLPAGMKRRLARSFGVKRAYGPNPMILGALASIVLLLVSAALVFRPEGIAPTSRQDTDRTDFPPVALPPSDPSAPAIEEPSRRGAISKSRPRGENPVQIVAKPPASRGKPPPFHAEGAFASGPPLADSAAETPLSVARIGVVRGDPQAEAGFFSYLAAIERQGGVGHRRIEVVEIPPCSGRQDFLFTVNLSATPMTRGEKPDWLSTPLLENLSVPRAALSHDGVFSIGSSAERQGRLLADHLLDEEALRSRPLSVAVIYRHPQGVFGDDVPRAVREVLEAAGVKVITMDYGQANEGGSCAQGLGPPGSGNPGATSESDPARFIPADVAILSMDALRARRFLQYAATQGYSPPLGFDGVYSMFDESLAPALGGASSIMSPYWVSNPSEEEAIRNGAASRSVSFGASTVHGWATAKAIAIALWKFDPDTAAEARAAMDALGPADLRVAPFEFRNRSRERSADAILLRPEGGRFIRRSDFRSDRR